MWSLKKGHILFSFVSDMLQEIAIKEKLWPDYVIQDYLIYYACRKFPLVDKDIENISKIDCSKRNDFAKIMNQQYNRKVYQRLIDSNFIFKLSFRSSFNISLSDGTLTFYGRILLNIIDPQQND